MFLTKTFNLYPPSYGRLKSSLYKSIFIPATEEQQSSKTIFILLYLYHFSHTSKVV